MKIRDEKLEDPVQLVLLLLQRILSSRSSCNYCQPTSNHLRAGVKVCKLHIVLFFAFGRSK